jgi:hypothetical protein
MLALLAKTATEPLVFSAPGGGGGGTSGGAAGASGSGASSSGGGSGAGGGGGPTPSASAGGGGAAQSASTSFKRLTSVLQRDTALFLLGEVFSAAGPALAASPLLVACVSRLVVPAIFSHLLSPRIAHATLSICTAPSMVDLSALAAGGAAAEAAGVSPSVAALAASAAGPRLLDPAAAVVIPPTSLYRGVLQVIGALWSARGAEEAASLCAQVAAATAALIAAARPANAFAGRGQVTSSLLLSASTGGGLPLRGAHGHSASAASVGSGFGAMLSPSGLSAMSPGGTSSAAYSSLPSLPSQAHAHLPTGSGGGALQLPSTAGRGGGGGSFPLSLSASPALSAAAAAAAAAVPVHALPGAAARAARLSGTSAGSSSTLRPSLPANLRESCAREVSALLRGVLLHTLASKTAPHALKLDAVEEASRWLGTPQALMELWINHDTWPSAGALYPHTRILRSLVATLVGAVLVRPRSYIALLGGATSGGEMVQVIGGAEVIVHPDALPITATPQERGLAADAWQREEFRKACATLLCGIVRGLMDSAATVHLPPSSSSAAASGSAGASAGGAGGGAEGWEEMDARPAAAAAAAGLSIQQALAAWGLTSPAAPAGSSGGAAAAAASSLAAAATRTASCFFGGGSGGGSSGSGGAGGAGAAIAGGSAGGSARDLIPTHRRSGSSGSVSSSGFSSSASAVTGLPGAVAGGPALVPVRVMHGRQTALESALLASLPVFRDRGVKKGLALLTAAGVVHASPRGVAHFLRLCGPSVAPLPELGDYLGDEGRGAVEKAAMAALRHEFFAGFSFSGMAFDAAMRLFLTKGGFRLPGEAQKIERITQAFSGAYYSANRPSRAQMEAAGYSPADIAIVESLAAGVEEARATQFAAAAAPVAAPAASGAVATAGGSSVQGTPDKQSQGQEERQGGRRRSVEGEAAQQQQPGHEEQAAQHAQQQQPGDTAAGPLERQPEEEVEEAPKRKAPKPVAAKPPPSLALGDGRFYPTALDVVEVLTFSCIMLNTDAHNRNIKRERKMTRRQFLSNNRHIDGGHDLPAAFLTYLYDAITGCEIRMGVPGVGSAAVAAPAAAGPMGGAAAGGTAGGAAGEALHFATPIAPPVPLPAAGSPAAAHVPSAASMIAEQVLALPAGGGGGSSAGGSAGAGKSGGGAAELGGAAAAAGAGSAAAAAPPGGGSAYSAATAYLAYLSGPLPGALALGEGGAPEPDGAVDAGAFASGLSDACWRWINHLCAGAKYADADAAGNEGGGVGSGAGGGAAGAGAGAAAAGGAAPGSFSAAISTAFLPPAPATGSRPPVPFVPDPYASAAIPYRRNFSVSTVACALVDLWPHIMRLAIMILRLQPPRGPALALGTGAGGGARGGSGAAASPSTPASVTSTSAAAGSVGAGTPGVAGAGLGAQHAAAKVANKRNSFAFFSFGSRANMAASAAGAATPTGAAAAAAGASGGAHAGTTSTSSSASTAPPSPGVDAAAVGGGYGGAAAAGSVPAPIPVAALRATTPSENEVRLLALDSLKYALSAALFLGLQRCIVEGADALLQVEAATLGPAVARESATNADSGWHAIVTRFARSRAPGAVGGVDSTLVAEAISVLHVVVAEMREAVTSQTEAANVEAVAERFRGDMARELAAEAHTRRLLLEGDLTKVAAEGRGKHTVYRFFLFTDMLVYAEKIAGAKALFGGGGKFTVHQRIPLGQIRSVEACAELTAQGIHTGFRVSNGVKPLILYAGSEAEARAWKRQINEAVAAYVHGDHDGFAAMGGLGGTVASAAAAAAAVAASQGTQGHNTSIGSQSGAGAGSTAAAAASARRNSVLTTFRRTSDIGIGAHAAAAALREGLGSGAHVPSATAPAGSLAGVGGGVAAGGGRPGRDHPSPPHPVPCAAAAAAVPQRARVGWPHPDQRGLQVAAPPRPLACAATGRLRAPQPAARLSRRQRPRAPLCSLRAPRSPRLSLRPRRRLPPALAPLRQEQSASRRTPMMTRRRRLGCSTSSSCHTWEADSRWPRRSMRA